MKKTKSLCLLLAIMMIISSFNCVFAINAKIGSTNTIANSQEKVKVIIEVKGNSTLSYPSAKQLGARSFLNTTQAESIIEKLVDAQEDVKAAITNEVSSDIEFKYSYTSVLNGFAAEVTYDEIEKIKNLDNVKNVYICKRYELPKTEMFTSAGMINVPCTWNTNLTGEGIVVAVMDSGTDTNHELMVLSKGVKGRMTEDFVKSKLDKLNSYELMKKDIAASDLYKNEKFPYTFDYADNDLDSTGYTESHGIHVAGTIAANNANCPDKFDGVAPEAQVVGLKVFGDGDAGAYDDDLIAALEDAITLEVDVINISLGGVAGFSLAASELDWQSMFEKVTDAGIFIAKSAGNNDRAGEGTVTNQYSLPTTDFVDNGLIGQACDNDCTGVASIDNTYIMKNCILMSDGNKFLISDTCLNYFGKSFPEIYEGANNGKYEYVDCGKGTPEDFEGKDVKGKIALMDMLSGLSFSVMCNNAAEAGAIGGLLYPRTQHGFFSMNLTGSQIPGVAILYDDALKLLALEDKTITINSKFIGSSVNKTGYQMSSFTSWGCTPDLRLKPEITAPGGQIYSTLLGGYGSMSGTSMASPHIAGAAALVKQYLNTNDITKNLNNYEKAQLTEKLLMSTASMIYDAKGNTYSPRRQGSGLADVNGAVKTEVYLENEDTQKAKVDLFEIGDTYTVEFDVVNFSKDKAYTYNLTGNILTDGVGAVQNANGSYTYLIDNTSMGIDGSMMCNGKYVAVTTSSAITGVLTTGSAITGSAVTTSTAITVAPGSTEHVAINVTLAEKDLAICNSLFTNGFFVEGFIELIPENIETPKLSIPYMGFHGKWDKAPVIDDSIYEDNPYYDETSLRSEEYDAAKEEYHDVYLGLSKDYETVSEDFIAFSPNGDKCRDSLSMRIALLRNAKTLKAYIKDSNNNIVDSESCTIFNEKYLNKTFLHSTGLITYDIPMWDGKDANGNITEGDYTVVIEGAIDYDNARTQVKEIPFSIDLTSPKITETSTTGGQNSTKYLNIKAEDNRFINYIAVSKLDGTVISEKCINDKKAEFVVNITDINEALVDIVVVDYAGNMDNKQIVVNPNNNGGSNDGGNGGGSDSGSGSGSGSGSTTPATMNEVITAEGKATVVSSDYIKATESNGTTTLVISNDIVSKINSSKNTVLMIQIQSKAGINNAVVKVSNEIAKVLNDKGMKLIANYEGANLILDPKAVAIELTMGTADAIEADEDYSTLDFNYNFDVKENGKSVVNTDNSIKISIDGSDSSADLDKAGVYTVDENGELEYVMTYLNGDVISFYPPHFSQYSVMIYEKTFADIQNHWGKQAIEAMASKHIVKGKTEDKFMPQDIVTRAEFVAMVVRALSLKGEAKSSFSNVDSTKWYANDLGLAKDAGLISGDTYQADGIISRVEMAKIISLAHAVINGQEIKAFDTVSFTDTQKDDNTNYIEYAVDNNLITGFGDKTFRPLGNTTRAEACTVISRLINK